MTQALIIYHKNCADGFTAAWVAHRAFGSGELLAANYGDAPPDVKGRDVVIADFSYPRDVLLDMKAQAQSLVVLDHHKTAKDALEGLDFCVFDVEECGASLTWKHYHPGVSLPPIVRYVKDRDLWLWKQFRSKEVSAYIGSLDQTLDGWDLLHTDLLDREKEFVTCVAAGDAILRSQHREMLRMAKDATDVRIHGVSVRAANAPVLISETGDHLVKTSPSGVSGLWHVKGDTAYWSLRSDGRVDVADLARGYGGGGHPKAAGFKIPVGTHAFIMGWSE